MTTINNSEIQEIQTQINELLENPEKLKEHNSQKLISKILRSLEAGSLRVMSPQGLEANCGDVPMDGNLQNWVVHSWVKNSILLAMRQRQAQTLKIPLLSSINNIENERIFANEIVYHDKFDLQNNLSANSIRSLPGSLVREGSHISKNVILMPSFVNIGAWIGQNTMIDTWATAGSCAQIGANVHVAGGVGIGGVLEPANARPVVVGDNAFLGSRVILVEGVIVSAGAILGANVCLTASTPIYDVTTTEKTEYRGFVPANAVVVSGTRTKNFPGGEVPLQCSYIIAYRNSRIDAKLSLNEILRETGIAT